MLAPLASLPWQCLAVICYSLLLLVGGSNSYHGDKCVNTQRETERSAGSFQWGELRVRFRVRVRVKVRFRVRVRVRVTVRVKVRFRIRVRVRGQCLG